MSDQNIFKPLWCYTYQYSPYKRVHPDSFLLLTLKYLLQHLFHCVRLFNICFSVPLQSKPRGLKEMKAPFLYAISVKRLELSAAMFTPSRLLLRLGNKMQSKLKKSLPRKVLFVCSEVMPYSVGMLWRNVCFSRFAIQLDPTIYILKSRGERKIVQNSRGLKKLSPC